MDNNNQTPNQNNQNGYTNFNNYQQPTPPQDNSAVPPQTNPYQQTPYAAPQFAYQTAPQQKSSTGFGVASIILGCIGCCCAPFSIVGAILGIVGIVRNKKSVACWIGLVLCVIATIVSIAYWGYIFNTMQDPDAVRQIYEDSGLYTEEQIEAMMDSLYGIIMRHFG